MSSVSKRLQSAKNPSDRPLPQFDVDPEAWLTLARSTLDDLIAAAEDSVRPLARRQLGRVEHIHIITQSGSALYDLLERLPGAALR
jgi:hypothetical protein